MLKSKTQNFNRYPNKQVYFSELMSFKFLIQTSAFRFPVRNEYISSKFNRFLIKKTSSMSMFLYNKHLINAVSIQ